MYRQMILCRTLDERIWMLNRQGKAAIVASAQGHEAAQIGSAWALRKGTDQFYIYYRDLATLLVLGMTPAEIMAGFLAKEGEPLSGARQFPTHGAYPEYGIINLSNVVATHVPQAVGAALAAKRRGTDQVAIAFFGDGAVNQGVVHESMNLAAVWKLPVIFACENNQYAESTPVEYATPIADIAERAKGYNMPGVVVDGMDAFAVYDAAGIAIGRARAGLGPTLLECKTYRYYGHAAFDNPKSYRTTEEENEWKARDAIATFRERVLEEGTLQLAELDVAEAKITEMMDDAVRFSDESPPPNLNELLTDVYVDAPRSSLGRSSHLFT